MDESTAIAPVGGGEIAPPSESAAQAKEPEFKSAVTADMIPHTGPSEAKGKTWTGPPPPTLTKDKKTNPDYLDYVASQLPAFGEAVETELEKQEKTQKEYLSLKKYGEPKDIKSLLDLVESIYEPNGNGIANALNAIADRDEAAYARLFHTVVGSDPHMAVRQLNEMGFPTSDLDMQPRLYDLSDDMKAMIPPELHETARTFEPKLLRQLAKSGTLVHDLETEKTIVEQWTANRERTKAMWDAANADASSAGAQQGAELADYWLDKHSAQLAKWSPTSNPANNEFLRQAAYDVSVRALLSAPEWLEMFQTIDAKMRSGPHLHIRGHSDLAERHEWDARSLAERFNARLGQVLKEATNAFNQILNPPAEEKPKEAEPPLEPWMTMKPGEWLDSKPPSLIPGTTKTNPAYLEWVAHDIERKSVITKEKV